MKDGCPKKAFSRSFPPVGEIKALLRELKARGISGRTRGLFISLSAQEPVYRLSVNLHAMLNLIYNHEVGDVLRDGLRDNERAALIELDSSDLPVEFREVAHGLLNVHERWVMLKSLSKMYRQARDVKGACVETRLLDDILGEED
jgi:hypothetical protein